MSAGDNELDYLHVPRNNVDAAIMALERELAMYHRDTDAVFRAVLVVLKELYECVSRARV